MGPALQVGELSDSSIRSVVAAFRDRRALHAVGDGVHGGEQYDAFGLGAARVVCDSRGIGGDMWVIFSAALSWVFRTIIVKFVVIGALFWLLTYLVPLVIGYITPFIGTENLTALFNAVPDGLFWFLLALRFDVGIPLLISAYVGRFLIRRLPFVG